MRPAYGPIDDFGEVRREAGEVGGAGASLHSVCSAFAFAFTPGRISRLSDCVRVGVSGMT